MNKDKDDIINFFSYINDFDCDLKPNVTFLIAPSAINIYLSQLINKTKIKIIAQDVSEFDQGSYTGQIASKTLSSYDINYCIVGHSETRKYFNITNKQINEKAIQCLNNQIKPIICVGENKEVYEQQKTINYIIDEIKACTKEIDINEVIIAYEPLWAIGTGLTPKISEIDELANRLKETFKSLTLIYGGSVNKNNINEIFNCDSIDGVLIGNASLNPIDYLELIHKI